MTFFEICLGEISYVTPYLQVCTEKKKCLNIFFLREISSAAPITAVHGRKTRDRISQSDWDTLAKQPSMFHNPLPWFDLPSYFIHMDPGVHIIFNNHAQATSLLLCMVLGEGDGAGDADRY